MTGRRLGDNSRVIKLPLGDWSFCLPGFDIKGVLVSFTTLPPSSTTTLGHYLTCMSSQRMSLTYSRTANVSCAGKATPRQVLHSHVQVQHRTLIPKITPSELTLHVSSPILPYTTFSLLPAPQPQSLHPTPNRPPMPLIQMIIKKLELPPLPPPIPHIKK